MGFLIYDIVFLVLFIIFLAFFLYIKREKLSREGWIFLYRTKIGLSLIDSVGKKHKKLLNILGYLVVFTGYILMASSLYLLYTFVKIFSIPSLVQQIKIPPLMPLIPYLPNLFKVSWLPNFYFTYFIIAIAIIAIFHEGFHGIYARAHKVGIKSTGFLFLGPLIGFFVEQDDKQIVKRKIFPQLQILGAGVFANIAVGAIFLILLAPLLNLTYLPVGIASQFYGHSTSLVEVNSITMIVENITLESGAEVVQVIADNQSYLIKKENLDNMLETSPEKILLWDDLPFARYGINESISKIGNVQVYNIDEFKNELQNYMPGEEISIETIDKNGKREVFNIRVGEKNNQPDLGVMYFSLEASGVRKVLQGLMPIFVDENIIKGETMYIIKEGYDFLGFIYLLFWWIVLINLSVAIVNMWPIALFDGGRFFYLTVLGITKRERIAKIVFKTSTIIILSVLALLMLMWAKAIFF